MERRAVAALSVVGLVAVVLLASPVSLLTATPPVYHDEYNLLAPAVALTEDGSLRMPLYDSTPLLETLFQGRGRFTPALNAGFYVSLGLWFEAFGVGIAQARAFVYLMGVIAVLEVLFLGWRWWNPWVGAIAALFVALDGTFWYASRQVRPETFTLAAMLGAAGILSARPARRARWIPAAGCLFGLGLTGHPVGAIAVPIVVLLPFVSAPPTSRERRAFLVPAAVIVLAYAAFLAAHYDGVLTNLRLHAAQRALGTEDLADVASREALRYTEGYWSGFAQGTGRLLRRAAWVGWALLVLVTLTAWWRGRRARTPMGGMLATAALFAAAPAFAMAGLALLGRDRNFLYLLHHLPWLALAGAAGPVAVARVAVPTSWMPQTRLVGFVAGLAALLVVAALGVRDYRRDTAPQREAAVVPYERIEAILAAHIPEGALVLGSETAWLAARQARAHYVFAKQYVQYLPEYARYPVDSAFDGSHLTRYEFDLPLLDELSAAGHDVYFVSDMWDWAWNVYAPFGRYAESFRGAQATFDARFTPLLRIFTRDRGWVILQRYGRAPGRGESRETVFVEGRRVEFGAVIPSRSTPSTGAHVETSGAPLAEWELDPRATYWLHGEFAVEGGLAVPVWSGMALPRFLDARQAVPLDAMVRGGDGRFALVPYPSPGRIAIDALRLRPIVFRR